MSGYYKVLLDARTDYRLDLRLSTRDNETGIVTPWDLTGLTFEWTVRDAKPPYEILATVACAVDGDQVRMHLSPADTAPFVIGYRYSHVVDVTYPTGDVKWVLHGPLSMREGVSQ